MNYFTFVRQILWLLWNGVVLSNKNKVPGGLSVIEVFAFDFNTRPAAFVNTSMRVNANKNETIKCFDIFLCLKVLNFISRRVKYITIAPWIPSQTCQNNEFPSPKSHSFASAGISVQTSRAWVFGSRRVRLWRSPDLRDVVAVLLDCFVGCIGICLALKTCMLVRVGVATFQNLDKTVNGNFCCSHVRIFAYRESYIAQKCYLRANPIEMSGCKCVQWQCMYSLSSTYSCIRFGRVCMCSRFCVCIFEDHNIWRVQFFSGYRHCILLPLANHL